VCDRSATFFFKPLALWYCKEHYKDVLKRFKKDIGRFRQNTVMIAVSKSSAAVWLGFFQGEDEKNIFLKSAVQVAKNHGLFAVSVKNFQDVLLTKRNYDIVKRD
jgi:hypothetical protein